VRPDLFVVDSVLLDLSASVVEADEPGLTQALVPELPFELSMWPVSVGSPLVMNGRQPFHPPSWG